MTPEDFRAVEQALASSHLDMAQQLGVSEVSVKRYATGTQTVPQSIAKLAVALLLIGNEDLHKKFAKLLAKYHSDT